VPVGAVVDGMLMLGALGAAGLDGADLPWKVTGGVFGGFVGVIVCGFGITDPPGVLYWVGIVPG
jgi:nitric oxide reductase large subunit